MGNIFALLDLTMHLLCFKSDCHNKSEPSSTIDRLCSSDKRLSLDLWYIWKGSKMTASRKKWCLFVEAFAYGEPTEGFLINADVLPCAPPNYTVLDIDDTMLWLNPGLLTSKAEQWRKQQHEARKISTIKKYNMKSTESGCSGHTLFLTLKLLVC